MNVEIIKEKYDEPRLNTIEYNLFIDGKKVGYLSIEHKNKTYVVLVANVQRKYRNRGFGKMLYLTALEDLGKLTTLFHKASYYAQLVWLSLIKKYFYRTNYFKGTLTVYNRRK